MIQVYTGNGKGKSTAAFGLVLRAVGAGLKVYILQFAKKGCFSEIRALKQFKNVKICQFGSACFIKGKPTDKDIKLARQGLAKIKEIINNNKYNVVVLDEINNILNLGILKPKEIKDALKLARSRKEFILTGRNAPREIIEFADLVSEIKEIKHYYRKGQKAREGIEF